MPLKTLKTQYSEHTTNTPYSEHNQSATRASGLEAAPIVFQLQALKTQNTVKSFKTLRAQSESLECFRKHLFSRFSHHMD